MYYQTHFNISFFNVFHRGNCTFLNKARNVFLANASGLVIVNSEDRIESVSSGYGVDSTIKESHIKLVSNFPIVTVSNTSWAKFEASLKFSSNYNIRPLISIVPLKCGTKGNCVPVTQLELQFQYEVSWGTLHCHDKLTNMKKSFQFLTSTYGSTLPYQNETNLELILSVPIDACSPLQNSESSLYGNILVVNRGNCRFDEKALNADRHQVRLLVIVDRTDNPLQRVGGNPLIAGYVGIPSILVQSSFGEYIDSIINLQMISVSIETGKDSSVSDAWIDLAYTEWLKKSDELELQIQSLIQLHTQKSNFEIVEWLTRKLNSILNTEIIGSSLRGDKTAKELLDANNSISDEL